MKEIKLKGKLRIKMGEDTDLRGEAAIIYKLRL